MTLAPVASAQTYRAQVLHTFHFAEGTNPLGNLIIDGEGNLYGTAPNGGFSYGTVFELTQVGKEMVLQKFAGPPRAADPGAGLLRDQEGNLYGTTVQGGALGYGTIFKLGKDGEKAVLHSFSGTDGKAPEGGLVMDASGSLYGTTTYGGETNCFDNQGCGVVFKLDKAGNETVLHTFAGPNRSDGANPYGTLVLDGMGNLYGTTQYGGASYCSGAGCGAVFKVFPTRKETLLYSFDNVEGDGINPQAGLARDAKGNLYGTTYNGGGSGYGTVFKVTPKGKETVLHNFAGVPGGANPYANLVFDPQGNLYGTTFFGGPSNDGIVFKVDPSGKETTLHAFSGSDGAYPEAGLLLDNKGNLYGTTTEGGDFSCNAPYGCGVVFKLSPK